MARVIISLQVELRLLGMEVASAQAAYRDPMSPKGGRREATCKMRLVITTQCVSAFTHHASGSADATHRAKAHTIAVAGSTAGYAQDATTDHAGRGPGTDSGRAAHATHRDGHANMTVSVTGADLRAR